MTMLEKALANLKRKGIDAKMYNDTIYVCIEWSELELAMFEIMFQAEEWDEINSES